MYHSGSLDGTYQALLARQSPRAGDEELAVGTACTPVESPSLPHSGEQEEEEGAELAAAPPPPYPHLLHP